MTKNTELPRCIKCNGGVCVCSDQGGTKWAAHCMDCDHSIGEPGYYDPCADTEEQAESMWIEMNTE